MRIVAGTLRGRALRAPSGQTTRPTTDRVREAVFSVLASRRGPDLGGGPVLDAFAGSGALGLEALSRGAAPVTFVERDRAVGTVIAANVEALGVSDDCRVVRGDLFSLAKRGVPGGPFALLLVDPPYTLDPTNVTELLDTLRFTGQLSDGCCAVWEHSSQTQIEWPTCFEVLVEKRYGTTHVGFAVYEERVGGQ